jgi:hypothetical protein
MEIGPLDLLEFKNKLRPVVEFVDPHRQVRSVFRNLRKARSAAVSASEGNEAIKHVLSTRNSVLIGRVGASEMKVVNRYLLRKRFPFTTYNSSVRREIQLHSGVYPATDIDLDNFAQFYLECIEDIDIFCAWFIPGERRTLKNGNFSTVTVLTALEPYFFDSPWSYNLSGKTVLVVTPFVETIRSQLDRLRLIWGYELFPGVKFEFIRFPHSQLLMGAERPMRRWFDILKDAQAEIDNATFEVGLVGAGAATLPLARYMKTIGKTGIAMGGALQILFGVRGRRWDMDPNFSRYFNQYWIRPLKEETPPKFKSNESGAYW